MFFSIAMLSYQRGIRKKMCLNFQLLTNKHVALTTTEHDVLIVEVQPGQQSGFNHQEMGSNPLFCCFYSLVMTNSSPWYRWPIEMDGLPFLKMGGFSMANC